MALIICPECNKEISNSVKKCPHCGYKIKMKQKKPKKEPRILTTTKRKKVFVVVISIIILALLGTGGFFGYKYYFEPMSNYKKAEELLRDNNFEEALDEFEKLADFKDSEIRVLEVHYKKAEYLLESQSYEEAVEEFEAAGKYEDSVEKIKEAKYEWADNTDTDKAIELYKELGDYKDAKDKLDETIEKKEAYAAFSKLQTAYSKCLSDGTSLSSDKKSITVDSSGKYDYISVLDIEKIIELLELPDSLYDEMCSTNALMGRQTEKYDYYEVSWSYHPDNGLDAIFKFVN